MRISDWSSDVCSSDLVSAGLGLVEASTPIPAYGCTVLVGADDGIQSRVDGTFSIASWWRALSSSSHLSRSLEALMYDQSGPLLVALSEAYTEMLAPELIALPCDDLARRSDARRVGKERARTCG